MLIVPCLCLCVGILAQLHVDLLKGIATKSHVGLENWVSTLAARLISEANAMQQPLIQLPFKPVRGKEAAGYAQLGAVQRWVSCGPSISSRNYTSCRQDNGREAECLSVSNGLVTVFSATGASYQCSSSYLCCQCGSLAAQSSHLLWPPSAELYMYCCCRVLTLKALADMRADREDMRIMLDDILRLQTAEKPSNSTPPPPLPAAAAAPARRSARGAAPTAPPLTPDDLRGRQPLGVDSAGQAYYWFDMPYDHDAPVGLMGSRLYVEGPPQMPSREQLEMMQQVQQEKDQANNQLEATTGKPPLPPNR